ncbi:MAG: hypothetical protein AAF718_12160 [Pseudomonadota bacterium]
MAISLKSCLTLWFLGAGGVLAEATEPLSVIDWLSNSVATAVPPPATMDETSGASAPEVVRVLPLDTPVPDAAGVVDPSALGIPSDFWGRSSAADLANALGRIRLSPDAPPTLSRFLSDFLQARLDPPIDAAVDDRLFFARVDRLLEKGHLDAARALVEATEVAGPQAFRRLFDVSLLQGAETEACRKIEAIPDLSPTYSARIFCLARLGEFDVAALTLGNAETLGILSPEEDALLLHFLDPELFEGEPIPPAPKVPTPLQFRLYEAVGERISTEGLPLAFAFADMSTDVGWKARLSAAERLATSEAISFQHLLGVYRERGPSASGAVWERIRAITALADALEDQDGPALVHALPSAWGAADQAGYTALLALWLNQSLPLIEVPNRATHIAFEAALLAGNAEQAERFASSGAGDQFLLSIARDQVGSVAAADPLGRAVLRGLSGVRTGSTLEGLISDDRRGEALLRAFEYLSDGAPGNPNITSQALTAVRQLGLNDLARQIAVELILKEGAI